ncbi:MAG: TolC family protein [Candidatus Riflebacteria bacterium]|nr:TolC family protein [Candidatus Riflebacteria bacterium]
MQSEKKNLTKRVVPLLNVLPRYGGAGNNSTFRFKTNPARTIKDSEFGKVISLIIIIFSWLNLSPILAEEASSTPWMEILGEISASRLPNQLELTTRSTNSATKSSDIVSNSLQFCASPSFSLLDCLVIAFSKNLEISAQKDQTLEARAKFKESKSMVKPHLNLQNLQTNQQKVLSFAPPGGGDPIKLGTNNLNISKLVLTQPVYSFGRLELGISMLKNQTKASEYAFEAKKIEVSLKVIQAFLDVLKASNRVAIASTTLDLYQKHLDLTNNLFENGTVLSTDVSATKVRMLEAKQKLLEEENTLELSRLALADLLMISPEELPTLREPPGLRLLSVKTGLASFSYSQPELKQLDQVISMNKKMEQVEKKGKLPIINMLAEYQTGNQFMANFKNWDANFVMDFPFFDSGYSKARSEQAKFELQRNQKNLELMKRHLSLEAKRSQLKMEELIKKLVLAAEAFKTAKENFEKVQTNYIAGTALNTDVLEAQLLFHDAKTSISNAFYDFVLFQAEYYKNCGALDKFIETLENPSSSKKIQ